MTKHGFNLFGCAGIGIQVIVALLMPTRFGRFGRFVLAPLYWVRGTPESVAKLKHLMLNSGNYTRVFPPWALNAKA